jgi:hypothetical protein
MVLVGERDRLRARVHTELLEDPLDVCPDGLRADEEPPRDLVTAKALGDQGQDLDLPTRERRLEPWLAPPFRPLQQPPHPCDELVEGEGLDEEVVAADEEAGDAVVRLGPFCRDEDDRQTVAELVPELAAHLVAGETREADLEHDHARPLPAGSMEPLVSGRCLPRHVSGIAEDACYERTKPLVAVDDQDRPVRLTWRLPQFASSRQAPSYATCN